MKSLLALVGALVLAACGDDSSSDPRQARREAIEARAQAEYEQAQSMRWAAMANDEARKLKEQVDAVTAELGKLDAQMKEAELQLTEAKTAAERDLIARRLGPLHTKQRELIARLDKIKAGVKVKCPPDNPLC